MDKAGAGGVAGLDGREHVRGDKHIADLAVYSAVHRCRGETRSKELRILVVVVMMVPVKKLRGRIT